jgi:hypothetical protein
MVCTEVFAFAVLEKTPKSAKINFTKEGKTKKKGKCKEVRTLMRLGLESRSVGVRYVHKSVVK